MSSTKKMARIAGLLYLVNGVTGFFGIIYVPGKLIVSGNAGVTASNILGSERLFRLGIASELICAAEFIFLVWVLYRLFEGVSKTQASLMGIWGLAFIPVMIVNTLSEIAALRLLQAGDLLPALSQPQRQDLAALFLDLHGYGYTVAWIFGPWLFFLGVLVYRSNFLPRFLGVLLVAACFGYVTESLAPWLAPGYVHAVDRIASVATALGEPAFILWLLIMGAKERPLEAAA